MPSVSTMNDHEERGAEPGADAVADSTGETPNGGDAATAGGGRHRSLAVRTKLLSSFAVLLLLSALIGAPALIASHLEQRGRADIVDDVRVAVLRIAGLLYGV